MRNWRACVRPGSVARQFQPTEKLVTKTRAGARTRRIYDRAQTPFQRLCAAGVLTAAQREALTTLYQQMNPLRLRRNLEQALEQLWRLAAPPPGRQPAATPGAANS